MVSKRHLRAERRKEGKRMQCPAPVARRYDGLAGCESAETRAAGEMRWMKQKTRRRVKVRRNKELFMRRSCSKAISRALPTEMCCECVPRSRVDASRARGHSPLTCSGLHSVDCSLEIKAPELHKRDTACVTLTWITRTLAFFQLLLFRAPKSKISRKCEGMAE